MKFQRLVSIALIPALIEGSLPFQAFAGPREVTPSVSETASPHPAVPSIALTLIGQLDLLVYQRGMAVPLALQTILPSVEQAGPIATLQTAQGIVPVLPKSAAVGDQAQARLAVVPSAQLPSAEEQAHIVISQALADPQRFLPQLEADLQRFDPVGGKKAAESLRRMVSTLNVDKRPEVIAHEHGHTSEGWGDKLKKPQKSEDPIAKKMVELLEVRQGVQKDARDLLRQQLGGDLGDGALHRDVKRVLRRLTQAAGLSAEAAQVFVGNSILPQAFTTLTQTEAKKFQQNAGEAKTFRVANIFVSLGLLRAMDSEARLAAVLAHELVHNLKGHLKGNEASNMLLGHFHEFEADAGALKLVAKAGYDPEDAAMMLYDLEAEYERLQRELPALKNKSSDLQQAIARLRDVHPDKDLRRANLAPVMDEALEGYDRSQPVPDNPVWMQRRNAAQRPTRFDRFQKKLADEAIDSGSVERNVHTLETLLLTGTSKERTPEELAVIEQAYQRILAKAQTLDDIRLIEVSVKRQGSGAIFPSRSLKAGLITRQVELTLNEIEDPDLGKFLKASGSLGTETRRAGALRLTGSASNRRQLDEAYRIIGREAEALGLAGNPQGVEGTRSWLWRQMALFRDKPEQPEVQADPRIAGSLWRAGRSVLSSELGRPALPEEIIDELKSHLLPSWLRNQYDAFNVQIIESAFGPQAYRSQRYRPSELAARLRGQSYEKNAWKATRQGGLAIWAQKHYKPMDVSQTRNGIEGRYETYALKGLSSPSPADLLDFALRFIGGDSPPKALTELLRREGRLPAFLSAVSQIYGEQLIVLLRQPSQDEQEAKDINPYTAFGENSFPSINFFGTPKNKKPTPIDWYSENLGKLMEAGLRGVSGVDATLDVLSTIWTPVEAALAKFEVRSTSGWDKLASTLYASMGDSLRPALTEYDRKGARPQPEELARLSGFLERVESAVGVVPGRRRLESYSDRLARGLGDGSYLEAYAVAEPQALSRSLDHSEPSGMGKSAMAQVATAPFRWGARLLMAIRRAFAPKLVPVAPMPQLGALTQADLVHFVSMVGDSRISAGAKIAAVGLLDRLSGQKKANVDDVMNASYNYTPGPGSFYRSQGNADPGQAQLSPGDTNAATVAYWLLEDAVSQARSPEELRGLTTELLQLQKYHPGLLQPSLGPGDATKGFTSGAAYAHRSEPFRALAGRENPFRAARSRWAAALLKRLDEAQAWPAIIEQTLDLLDLLNSSGEYDEAIDRRIVETAKADAAGFARWIAHDRDRTASWKDAPADVMIDTPYGKIPMPQATPLRIVRNPALRAQLFDLLPEAKLGEKPSQTWRDKLKGKWALWKAYRAAQKLFSSEFLNQIQRAGSMEDKLIEIMEEADRIAQQRANQAAERWRNGKFSKDDDAITSGVQPKRLSISPPLSIKQSWFGGDQAGRDLLVRSYKEGVRAQAMSAITRLGLAYVGSQDPLLQTILQEYPEPTRWRDDLLERLIKARKLSPGALSLLEAFKSYRMPNPLRAAEKHLMDLAVQQMAKFTAAEKVDVLLDLADIRPLSQDQLKRFEGRVLNAKRRKAANQLVALGGVSDLKSYVSFLHPEDRALIVRALFYGEQSLHQQPEEVERLFRTLITAKTQLDPQLEKILMRYFRILSNDEKTSLLADLAGIEDLKKDLTGPEILKVALMGKVTGAKIAQVLSSHPGLLPPGYAEALEDSKDRAQKMVKARFYDLMMEKLAALLGSAAEAAPPNPERDQKLQETADATLARLGVAERQRLVKQVKYLLEGAGRRLKTVQEIGPELGTGSIKIVYKIELDDGRLWVVKLRAPGAAQKIKREFEVIDQLIVDLQADGEIDASAAAHWRQLQAEVRQLIEAEMDFSAEALKEIQAIERAKARPWYVRWLAGGGAFIPRPHAQFVHEDFMIEEFLPSTRFADLPQAALLGPSRRSIARQTIDEGMLSLVFDEWLEPDAHSGNRLAQRGWLGRLLSRLVVIDLGQGEPAPIARLKPFLRAGIALESGDTAGAARELSDMLDVPHNAVQDAQVRMEAALSDGSAGFVERLVGALVAAERAGALPRPEYAALEKAFVVYLGYSPLLPKDYLYTSFQRALGARLLRDRPVSLWELARLAWTRWRQGTVAVRPQVERLIDGLGQPAEAVQPSR